MSLSIPESLNPDLSPCRFPRQQTLLWLKHYSNTYHLIPKFLWRLFIKINSFLSFENNTKISCEDCKSLFNYKSRFLQITCIFLSFLLEVNGYLWTSMAGKALNALYPRTLIIYTNRTKMTLKQKWWWFRLGKTLVPHETSEFVKQITENFL